ncbi:MAG: FlgD immunoglobulin-like domain containing protein [Candidatus Eisenbacteria bacterium]
MRVERMSRWGFVFAVLLVLPVGQARGDFVPVEDFDDLVLGPVDDQGGWYAASSNSVVAADPADGENQVLSVTTESTHLHREVLLPNGTVRMLFLRFRYASQLNVSFGLSGQSFPTQFGDFEPELSLTNATSELRVNDGGSYDVLAVLQPNVWYNCWMLIDNLADSTRVWLHARPGDDAGSADLLAADGQTDFEFRSGYAPDLVALFIKTGGGSGPAGPLFIDDIYLENTNALNLTNPSGVQTTPVAAAGAPGAFYLAPISPNPFNPRTEIRFALREAANVQLAVYDISGRRVAVLAEGEHGAGEFTRVWNGTNDAGRGVASGPYFVRFEADGFAATRKTVLAR